MSVSVFKIALAYVIELNERSLTELGSTFLGIGTTDGEDAVIMLGSESVWDSHDYDWTDDFGEEEKDVEAQVRQGIEDGIREHCQELLAFVGAVFVARGKGEAG